MKSGNLNFLEPSGPLQACNGTALPYLYMLQPSIIDPFLTVSGLKLITEFLLQKDIK